MLAIRSATLSEPNTCEGYGDIRHALVMFDDGSHAHVNPVLFKAHGAAAIGMPDWFRGVDVPADYLTSAE